MGLTAAAFGYLSLAIAKVLFKRHLGVAGTAAEALLSLPSGTLAPLGEGAVEGLADLAKDRLKDTITLRETVREFEGLADKIVKKLQVTLAQRDPDAQVDFDAIGRALAKALEGRAPAEFLNSSSALP